MNKYTNFENVTAITSTRDGGVSLSPYNSLNLAFQSGDKKEDVINNRSLFFANNDVNITRKNTVFVAQSHSTKVLKVTHSEAGKGFDSFEDGVPADALYTTEKGLNLVIYHADCVPVFISIPTKNIVGIIHAGKPGSLNNITGEFIKTVIEKEQVKPEEIYAHLGPSLSFEHRQISEEEAFELAEKGGIISKAVKATLPVYFLDLPLLNILSLRQEGVPLDNISFSNECTYENNDKYYSANKEVTTGRNISFIRRD